MYAPAEVWSITCTNVGLPAVFSVVGSVSGAQADATAGVAYDNGLISFTISAGGTAWEVADLIEVTVPNWYEIFFEAPGNGGTEEIYMGIKTYTNDITIDQWKLNGYTGYNPAADFSNQPGAISDVEVQPRCLLWGGVMPYWLVANGRRVTLFYEVAGVIECMYLGFILPYGLPTENPYPMAVGGTTVWSTHAYTSTSEYHAAFWDGPCEAYNIGNYTTLRCWDGASWNKIGGHSILSDRFVITYEASNHGANWPYHSCGKGSPPASLYSSIPWNRISKNSDDSYCLFPIIPHVPLPDRILFGELEGIYAVPGVDLGPLDTTTINAVDYILVGNTFRSDQNRWAALRLE